MKPHGSKFEYEQERNHDLMRAYHQLINQYDHICLPLVYQEVVNLPSARFWVSEERAAIVIASMMHCDKEEDVLADMRPNKKEMFREIYSRAKKLREEFPSMSVFDIAFKVVRQPAPKFYLTPGSARVIIYKAKKAWFEERKRKLRHLF